MTRRRQGYSGTFPPPGELGLILAGAFLIGASIAIGMPNGPLVVIGGAVLIVLALLLQVRRQM